MKKITLFFLLVLGIAVGMPKLAAQQSSKSKAAKKLYEKGNKIKVINTTLINTENLEFSPTFYQNGIVFATSRKTEGEKDKKIGETYFELFYADRDGNGMPLEPESFSLRINSQLHEGPVTFSRDGSHIYFTRNNLKKGVRKADDKGIVRLKIYEGTRGKTDWENVQELSFNSDAYSTCHPTLSADGQKLYFSSDMPGGLGGMDLWMVERQGNSWSVPINLGQQINTKDNEVFPFIHSSGNLFFASNGYPGEGGLDLFLASFDNGPQGEVISLGEPFNTSADDLGLILNPEGTMGYFTSSREGGRGKDDIYLFEAPEGIWGKTKPGEFSTLISVFDDRSADPIEGAAIRIFERTADGFIGSSADLYEAILMPAKEGSSELIFKLVRKDASALGEPDKLSNEIGQAETAFMGEKKYLLLVTKEGYSSKEVVYSTIGNIGEGSIEIPLNKVSCGDMSGIVRDKNTNKAIGNAIIRVWSGCDGSEEIIVTNDDGAFNYCLPPGCEYMVKGVKEAYTSEFKKISATNSSGPFTGDLFLTPLGTPSFGSANIETGTVIILEKIYYDFDKSYIRKGAAREMDEVLEMMQRFPSIKIELIAHTDSRGSDKYNNELSRRRAESAKKYLIAKGIAASRIMAMGKGESELRNKCADGVKCNETEHQFNRRTEIKVTEIDEPVDVRYRDNEPEKIDRKN